MTLSIEEIRSIPKNRKKVERQEVLKNSLKFEKNPEKRNKITGLIIEIEKAIRGGI